MADKEQEPPPADVNPAPSKAAAPAPAPAPVPAPAVAPPAPSAGPTPDKAATEMERRIAAQEEELKGLRQRLDTADARAVQESVQAAGRAAGVRDAEYFEFLASKERGAKGEAFNLGEFVTGLKTKRPDLFAQATASAAHGTSGLNQDQRTALRAQYDEALKKGDTFLALQLKTRLQQQPA